MSDSDSVQIAALQAQLHAQSHLIRNLITVLERNGTLQERDFVTLRDTSLWSKATTREVGSAFADLMDNLGATRAGRPDVD